MGIFEVKFSKKIVVMVSRDIFFIEVIRHFSEFWSNKNKSEFKIVSRTKD